MSAYIVSNETINEIVQFVTFNQWGAGRYSNACYRLCRAAMPDIDRHGEFDEARLGFALWHLNVEAVSQRYPGETLDELPGPVPAGYHYQSVMLPETIRAYKHLRCLLYQCSEGTVPETPLYQALEALSDALAHGIICASDEYEQSGWGA